MKDEWWLRSAISDDKTVAHLLLRLKHSADSFPSWGLRQPRSKPRSTSSSFSLSAPTENPPEKKRDTDTRRSPTTPLSWTGCGGSPSEESSPSVRFRSKISATSDTPTTSSKRPKRKKTFTELKEEESSLLKERAYLNKELATLHMTLKVQRSINENLKRIKLDLRVESGIKSEAKSILEERNGSPCKASSSSVSRQDKTEDASEHLCLRQNGASCQEPVFVLPDLNMAPDEECDLFGMS